MYQGSSETVQLNWNPLDPFVKDISAVLLTHAHLDHGGRLPLLTQAGFSGPIYMTAPTKMLLTLTLNDALKISEQENPDKPFFSRSDVDAVLAQATIINYHQPFTVEGVSATYYDAGHILGSASIELVDADKRIVFSGDIGNYPEELMRPSEFMTRADVVVMESTYGDKDHPKEPTDDVIATEINTLQETGGTLLIPAFSLERTQVLLHKLDHLKREKKISSGMPVYLDSPMGRSATAIYKKFVEYFNKEIQQHELKDDPFDFPGLQVIERPQDSKHIHMVEGPKVIIAGSGMMTGGRIVGHAKYYLSKENTRVLIIGYQGEETMGRELVEGATETVIDGVTVPVHAHISTLHSMSAHADQTKLLQWLQNIQGVKKVFLTHGDPVPRQALKDKIMKDLAIADVITPALEEEHTF